MPQIRCTYTKNKDFTTMLFNLQSQSYRFSCSIWTNKQGQGVLKLYDMLIIRTEGSNTPYGHCLHHSHFVR